MNLITAEMRLLKLLEDMDVPEKRKDLSKPENMRWLQRNLRVINLVDFLLSQKALIFILQYKTYSFFHRHS